MDKRSPATLGEIEAALWLLHEYESNRVGFGVRYDEAHITRLVETVRSLRSETATSEGYPGIAHDFEKMRSALEYIARLPNDYPVSAIADRAKRALPEAPK